jgi:hypothetical protein
VRDETFTLLPAAGAAQPPFRYDHVVSRRKAEWRIHDGSGRAIGTARTRAGARRAVHRLWERLQDAQAAAAMRGAA